MTKLEFLTLLRDKLSGFAREDIEERLSFYGEMIDDRIEEGLSEEQAVLAVGSVDEIVAHIIADTPRHKNKKKQEAPKRRLKAWEIVLLSVGSPVWLSLLIAAFAVAISLYASLWAVIVSLWACFAALVASAFGGVAGAILFALTGNGLSGLATVGAGLICAGLSILAFFGCRAATNGTLLLTKKAAQDIKKCLTKKGEI